MDRGPGMNGGRPLAVVVALGAALLAAGCAHLKPPEKPPDYFWIVHSRDRSDTDRSLDQTRLPEKLLEFWDVRPGMRVAELGAGDGYYTELLARVVGGHGKVYAQVPPNESKRTAARLAVRLGKPVMRSVVHVVRPFDDPLPQDARDLDLITTNQAYDALLSGGIDRARMSRAVFSALKPGGVYVLMGHTGGADASAKGSRGERPDAASLRRELEAAGLMFVGDPGMVQGVLDSRDSPAAVLADRVQVFVLKFVKPKP